MFDVAERLLVVEVVDGAEVSRSEVSLSEPEPLARARAVKALGVDVLVCGAVSWPVQRSLVAAGVRVVPQICGMVQDVLEAFVSGQLSEQAFSMPGCCGRRRRGRQRQGRRGQGFQGDGR